MKVGKFITAAAVLGCVFVAQAQGAAAAGGSQEAPWPSRPVRIVVPSAAATSTDYLARTFGKYLSEKIKVPVVIDNKPGAAGIIALEAVKRAAPDGYTLVIGSVTGQSVNPAVYQKLPYDPAKDFVNIGMFTVFPYIVAVRNDSTWQSFDQLLAAARAKPGKVTCATSATASHVACELIAKRANVEFTMVPYKSPPQVLTDIAGGQVDFTVLDAISVSIGLKNGLVKGLVVTSASKSPSHPGIRTAAETLPDFIFEGWAGLSAPIGTPTAILEQLNVAVREALETTEFKTGIEQQGGSVRVHTLAEQARFVNDDRLRWKTWVKDANIPRQ